MKLLRKYWLFLSIIALDIFIWRINPPLGNDIVRYTTANFREMLLVIPPIFLLLGLLDVWVPRELMIRLMGEDSGFIGPALSVLLGAASAGPLYGAFPIAVVMAKKGAALRNVFIFLSAWATLKIPMFLFETAALGLTWSVTRWIASIIGTFLIAGIIDRSLSKEERAELLQNMQQQEA